jgi:hypothetical protein
MFAVPATAAITFVQVYMRIVGLIGSGFDIFSPSIDMMRLARPCRQLEFWASDACPRTVSLEKNEADHEGRPYRDSVRLAAVGQRSVSGHSSHSGWRLHGPSEAKSARVASTW